MSLMIKKIVVFLVVLQVLLYEWGIFELSSLGLLVNFLKMAIPFFLFAIAISVTKLKLGIQALLYVVCFAAFGLYAVLPTLFSDSFTESFLQYLKIIPPRFLFIVAISAFFSHTPELITSINKVFFYIAIFTLVQFFFAIYYVNLHPFEGAGILSDRGSQFAGPLGLFGNVVTQFMLPFGQAVRLTGFWIEPSNASGFLLSIFFLGLAMKKAGSLKVSGLLYSIPLITGFLALSSAGYVAFAVAYCFYLFVFRRQDARKKVALIVALSVVAIGLFGRYFYMNYFYDDENLLLRAILGVRDTNEQGADFTGGRISNYTDNIKVLMENPLGIGFRIPGENTSGKGFQDASASAIFYIATYTGFIGLLIMLMSKVIVASSILKFKKDDRLSKTIKVLFFCGWLVISVQNVVYGTWLSFFYLYMSVATIVSFSQDRPYEPGLPVSQ